MPALNNNKPNAIRLSVLAVAQKYYCKCVLRQTIAVIYCIYLFRMCFPTKFVVICHVSVDYVECWATLDYFCKLFSKIICHKRQALWAIRILICKCIRNIKNWNGCALSNTGNRRHRFKNIHNLTKINRWNAGGRNLNEIKYECSWKSWNSFSKWFCFFCLFLSFTALTSVRRKYVIKRSRRYSTKRNIYIAVLWFHQCFSTSSSSFSSSPQILFFNLPPIKPSLFHYNFFFFFIL